MCSYLSSQHNVVNQWCDEKCQNRESVGARNVLVRGLSHSPVAMWKKYKECKQRSTRLAPNSFAISPRMASLSEQVEAVALLGDDFDFAKSLLAT